MSRESRAYATAGKPEDKAVTADIERRKAATRATPVALTVLRPGDRVLCVFSDDRNIDHVKQCLDQLRERFADVEFSALAGADQVLVQPSEGTP